MIFNAQDYVDPQRVRIYLAKPDRTIIGEVPEAYDVKRNVKLGNVFTLEFKIPYQIVDYRKQLVNNENITKTKSRYLIKFVYDNLTEWYLIKTPTDTMEEDVDYKLIEAYSLEYELAAKNIRNLSVVSYSATQILNTALSETLWTTGYIDGSYDVLFRAFDVANSSVLDFVYQIASTFNALATFDTINRKVNFFVMDNYGTNKGLEASYGNLLKSASKVENTDEFYTRLKAFGKDGISISGQNITGQNYIEDYSAFIYPFQRDESKNVLSHSDYMTDSLCNAILDYQELLTSSAGTYQTYLTQLSGYQSTLTSQQNVLYGYQNDLATIEDQIAAANYRGDDTSSLVTQKNAKQSQIDSQNAAISTTQGSINTVNANITALQNSLAINNNFTNEQIQEWNYYIIVGTFENTNVDDQKQLLQLAQDEFEKLKQAKIVVNISIVNFLECIQEKDRWGMLNLGDTITIRNAKLGLNVQAKIIEMDFDYDAGEVQLTISNVKELLGDKERFLRDLYRANMTSGTVTSESWKWGDAYDSASEAQQILNSTWDATARSIKASVDNTVDISRKGIIVSDPNTPNEILILQKGLLAISGDGGNTWKTAVNSSGVFAQRLVGQILIGTSLSLSNSGGTFSVNSSGVTISGLALTITGGLGDGNISSSGTWNTAASQAANSVQLGTAYNSTVISAADGIVVTASNNLSRALMSGTTGFKIQKNVSGTWTDQFYADGSGNLILAGNISVGSGNSIFKADGNGIYLGNTSFSSAPFHVDLNGNAYANTMTLANSNFQDGQFNGNITSAATITGGTIVGSTFTTSAGYPRIQINSDGIQSLSSAGVKHGLVTSPGWAVGSSPTPDVMVYVNGVERLTLSADSNGDAAIFSASNMRIDASGQRVYSNSRWELRNDVLIHQLWGYNGDLLIKSAANFSDFAYFETQNVYMRYLLPSRSTNTLSIGSGGTVYPFGTWDYGNVSSMRFSTTSSASSGSSNLPSNPAGFFMFPLNGSTVKVPYYF